MKPIYTATVLSSGGRQGHVKSSDGILDFDVSMPKEMGGKGGATNPEQLFAAGYSACFEGALLKVAGSQKIKLTDTSITGHVTIGSVESGFQLAAELEITASGTDQATLDKLVNDAHQVCPYSKATRGNIEVTLKAHAK